MCILDLKMPIVCVIYKMCLLNTSYLLHLGQKPILIPEESTRFC